MLLGPGLPGVRAAASEGAPQAATCKVAKARKGAKARKRAKTRKAAKARARAPRPKVPVEIPVNIGVGPALHMAPGGLGGADLLYTGLKLDVFGVVGEQVIKDNLHRIPRRYARLAKGVTEVRINPLPWVPETLMLSPERKGDEPRPGMYGVMWRVLGVGLSSGIGPLRLGLSGGVGATYLFVHGGGGVLGESDPMHFLRPGVDLRADLEAPLGDSLLVSAGWHSFVFVPQEVGGSWAKVGDPQRSVWHLGQAYFLLHLRVPYEVRL